MSSDEIADQIRDLFNGALSATQPFTFKERIEKRIKMDRLLKLLRTACMAEQADAIRAKINK